MAGRTTRRFWLGRSFTGQFSLAGAQAKTALLFKDGRWGVPSGSTATTHILKPVVAARDDHDPYEHLCLDAARGAGLVAARTKVSRFGDESAAVVDRYDRREVGVRSSGSIRRISARLSHSRRRSSTRMREVQVPPISPSSSAVPCRRGLLTTPSGGLPMP
ncbi:MAG: HipA domain-containing protein [Acidimicrobiales bacterium]